MKHEIEKVIDDLEKLKNDNTEVIGDLFDSGFDCGLNAAQERLRELIKDGTNDSSGISKTDEATQV